MFNWFKRKYKEHVPYIKVADDDFEVLCEDCFAELPDQAWIDYFGWQGTMLEAVSLIRQIEGLRDEFYSRITREDY